MDMEARACDLAEYLLANNATVRAAAKQFGVSKSTVHKDLTERLEKSRCGSCSTATRPSGTSAAAWRRGENTKVHNPDRGTSFRKNRGYYR